MENKEGNMKLIDFTIYSSKWNPKERATIRAYDMGKGIYIHRTTYKNAKGEVVQSTMSYWTISCKGGVAIQKFFNSSFREVIKESKKLTCLDWTFDLDPNDLPKLPQHKKVAITLED